MKESHTTIINKELEGCVQRQFLTRWHLLINNSQFEHLSHLVTQLWTQLLLNNFFFDSSYLWNDKKSDRLILWNDWNSDLKRHHYVIHLKNINKGISMWWVLWSDGWKMAVQWWSILKEVWKGYCKKKRCFCFHETNFVNFDCNLVLIWSRNYHK